LSVSGTESGDCDLRLAAGLCEQIAGHLSVLVLSIASPPPIGDYGAVISDAWVQGRQAELDRLKARAVAVGALLAAMPVSADISSDNAETAAADDIVGQRARYADLTMAGPELLCNEYLRGKVIEGALFSSGKPLLLVPDGSRPTLQPKRIAVAWDSRIEASRAVREALELMKSADEVRLVLVDPVESGYGHGEEPGADAAAYLARHGVNVIVDRLPGMGQATASVLRRHVVDAAADLLVMGAYGHSRLRERIFGGVTRSMLEAPPLPILMAR
jgi:nucleotide-binding universal stress UspA family protein